MVRSPAYSSDNPLAGTTWETQQFEWMSEQQSFAFRYGPDPLCLSGGFGGGKTVISCAKVLRLSDMYPRNRGVIARRVGKELEATTKPTFFKYCPEIAYRYGRRNDQAGILRLNNGSEILFLHMDKPEIETIIAGLEINWFLLDQAEEMNEEIFTKLQMRLGRWDQTIVPQEILDDYARRTGRKWPWWSRATPMKAARPIPPNYQLLTCNPEEEDHWIYKRFHPDSTQWQENYRHKGYLMVDMPSTSNRGLPSQNLEHMLAQDADYVDRYVIGKWGRPRGTLHDIHKDSLIIGTQEVITWIKNYCQLVRLLDHGDSAPTCCLWMASDGQGNIIFYREYYLEDALVTTHRKSISELSEGEKYDASYADPEIFGDKQQGGGTRWSIADEYARVEGSIYPAATSIVWTKADNNELGTRNKTNEYLKFDPEHRNPFTGERGAPHVFFIMQSLAYPHGIFWTTKQIKSAKRQLKGYVNGVPIYSNDRVESIPDHAYDPFRYGVATRPFLSGVLDLAESSTEAGLQMFEGLRRKMREAQSGARRSIVNELMTGNRRLPF